MTIPGSRGRQAFLGEAAMYFWMQSLTMKARRYRIRRPSAQCALWHRHAHRGLLLRQRIYDRSSAYSGRSPMEDPSSRICISSRGSSILVQSFTFYPYISFISLGEEWLDKKDCKGAAYTM